MAKPKAKAATKPKAKAAERKIPVDPPFNSSLVHGEEVSRKSERVNDHTIHHKVKYQDGVELLHIESREVTDEE